jgi:hypothetical protein
MPMFPKWSLSTKPYRHFCPPALPPPAVQSAVRLCCDSATLRTAVPAVAVRISTVLKTVFRGFTQNVPAEVGVSQTMRRSSACTFLPASDLRYPVILRRGHC